MNTVAKDPTSVYPGGHGAKAHASGSAWALTRFADNKNKPSIGSSEALMPKAMFKAGFFVQTQLENWYFMVELGGLRRI